MSVKISVIIPVYNGDKYLDECVSSVVGQSLRDIEIIIVNDGSTDGSGKTADRFAESDGRIKVIHQSNRGVSAARNAALEAASGEYVGFVDSDDVAAPEMFESLYESAKELGADIVTSGYRSFNNAGESKLVPPPFAPGAVIDADDIKKIAAGMHSGGSFLFIWRSIFSLDLIRNGAISFDADIAIGEDTLFCMECYLNAKKAAAVGKAFYGYRIHGESAMRKKHKPKLASSLTAQYIKKAELCRRFFPELAEEYFKDAARHTATVLWNILICNIYQSGSKNKMKQLRSISRSEMFADCFKYFDTRLLMTRSLDTIALYELCRGRPFAAHLLLLAAFKSKK